MWLLRCNFIGTYSKTLTGTNCFRFKGDKLSKNVQWCLFITDTFEEQGFGPYTEVAFVDGLFVHKLFIWDLAFTVVLYSEVAIKNGSTV